MEDPKISTARESTIGVRFTEEEKKIVKMVADEGWDSNLSNFCREAILTMVERYVENKELVEGLGGEKEAKDVQASLSEMIEDAKEMLANSIHQSNEGLSKRITRLEKFMGSFLYAYLYHTPEISEDLKKEAAISADERVKKVMVLCEDE